MKIMNIQKSLYEEYLPLLRQIRASAGSGKTYELTHSFLTLLNKSINDNNTNSSYNKYEHSWASILAITFTNRAAAEMQQRIITRLKQAALNTQPIPGLTSTQAAHWINIFLRNYSELNICTIDSLLHTIVHITALELHLPPDFQPIFSTEEALTPLLDSILKKTQHNERLYIILKEACSDILFHTKHNNFMIGSTLREKVLSILPLLINSDQEITSPQEITAHLTIKIQSVKKIATELASCIKNEQLSIHSNFKKALEACQIGTQHTIPPKSTMLRKPNLTDCILKSSKNPPSHHTTSLYNTLQSLITYLDTTGVVLKNSQKTIPYVKLAKELYSLLPEFFCKQRIILAELIPSLAQQAISGGYGISGIFCKLGTNLQHILIDEFQDTSHEQWAVIQPLIVEALSYGGSLTWVGDVKQAIYGWRGGDTTLFEKVLSDPELRSIASYVQKDILPINWRSSYHIVNTNNTLFTKLSDHNIVQSIFSKILPNEIAPTIKNTILSEQVPLVTQSFADAEQSIAPNKKEGYVYIQRILDDEESEPDIVVHDTLIDIIHDIQTRRSLGDVAILVRSKKRAMQVANWLMEKNIPVVTENSFLLIEHPIILQFIAILEFLDSPQNDLAFWRIVNGGNLVQPLLNIPQQKLDEWICIRNRSQPLYLAFKADFPDAWEHWILPFYDDSGLLSAYDAIQESIDRLKIKKRFPKEMSFIRRFLEIIYIASTKGYDSISNFLEYWKQYGHKEKTPMPENIAAVRIMTIHKSKGLQFPIVIIPWHDFPLKPNDSLIQTCVDGFNIIVKQSPAMPKEYYNSLLKNACEALNLLYVAWTRAEEELYALITSTTSKKMSFTEAIKPILDYLNWDNNIYQVGEKTYISNYTTVLSSNENSIEIPSIHLEKKEESTSSWRPMHWLPQLRIFRNPVNELGITSKKRGIFIHHCLQYLCISKNPNIDISLAVDYAIKRFPLPLPSSQYNTIVKDVLSILQWYTSLPKTRYWIQFGLAEQTLLDKNNNIYRVDLLVNNDKEYSVIEYKTGETSPQHIQQLQKYLDIIKEATSLPVKGYIIYLDLKRIHTIE